MTAVHLLLAGVTALSVSNAPTDRLAMRAELMSLLETTGPPRVLAGRALDLVQEMELLETVPATPGFLTIGTNGVWALAGVQDSPDRPEALETSGPPPAVEVLQVRQTLDFSTEKAVGNVHFRVVEDDLQGELILDAICAQNGARFDTLNYVTTGRQLKLPGAPSCPVPAMMEALHAQLSHDFLGDEGVLLGLQTTYLDEALRITRCTTRDLASSCAVHTRVAS